MVETVLSRDKNWVRWKIEGCPSIELPLVLPQTFIEARTSVGRLASTKRLRATPLGSLSLNFLDDSDEASLLEKFKAPDRYGLPELASFKRGIADDDFEIEMPSSSETKAAAIEGKASKSWRALRIASKYKLAAFDKVDTDDKIDAIFEENTVQQAEESPEVSADDAVFPEDRRPIIIVDAAGTISGLMTELIIQHPGTFGKVLAHVTRKPEETEANGKDYHFIDGPTFNVMRDGDQFLAYSEDGERCRGTSRRLVESISESGKVPVLELSRDVSIFI